MAYRIELSEGASRDLETVFDFLIESYLSLGDTAEDAAESLREFPHRATTDPDLPAGIRSLIRAGAILYFEIDEAAEAIRVLAIFLAGQDHRRRMLLRAVRPEGRPSE